MTVRILIGDVRERLKDLPDESVHCVVTSPPYFGLRDYGVEGQIGLETSPTTYVETIVEVFRAVRRVVRHDGTCWLNLGDSYANDGKWGGHTGGKHVKALHSSPIGRNKKYTGLKPKDLIGIPWAVAVALRTDGWWLRQDIIWSKPNPMPESIRDRCTKAHEYLFLLTKAQRYYFNQEAILEPASPNTHARLAQDVEAQIGSERAHAGGKTNGNMKAVARRGGGNRSHKGTTAYEEGATEHRTKAGLVKFAEKQRKLAEAGRGVKNNGSFDAAMAIMPEMRNRRSVWEIATQPFSEAHFATFPPALIEPCILAGCPPGGTVLDPFGGAGTTGLVADRLQRNAILIEINPQYAAMAEKRIHGDAPLFSPMEAAE